MTERRNGDLTVAWRGGDRFDVRIRRHVVRVDQLRDFGGSDTGPTPAELFVGGVAAYAAHCAERYLRRYQLPAGVTVTAHYELGPGPARLRRIDLALRATDLPRGLRDSLAAAVRHGLACDAPSAWPQVTLRVLTADDAPLPG